MPQSTNHRIRNRRLFKLAQQGKESDFSEITPEDNVFDATNPAGNTVLHVASMSGQEATAKMLSRKRPSLILTKNLAGNTPLHYALKIERYVTSPKQESNDSLFMHFMGVLEEEKKKDLEIGRRTMRLEANEAGESLLFLAADRGLLESVKRLLTGGVLESDCTGPNGRTALHAAIFRRNKEIAKELLKCKPGLNNIGDDSGNTPLHYAVANHDYELMVEPMLECDDAAPDDSQSIAYHGNDDGHTPLHVAAAYGCKSMVKAIVDRHPGCVTLTDNQGRTALHVAVQAHQKAVVKHILKHCEFAGLINDRDIDGNSPLHLAALNHNHEMVSILLSTWVRHKPDTNPMNNAGQTPRDILDPVNFPEIFLGHFKRIFEVYAGIKCPRSILFTEAGGKHGPRLCDLPNKLNQSGERRAAATEKPKANGSNGHSYNKEAAAAASDDGGKGKARMVEKLASNLMLAATLIITVTFAAIITMPGGFESDQNNTTNNNGYKGTAVLARRLAFQVFVLTDTLAFLLSFRAALRLIWTALMNGVDLLIDDVRFAQWMVQAALVAMTLAFGTGAYSVLERHCNWIAEVVLVVVCFFSLSPFMELVPSILGKCQEALRALLPTLRLTYKTIEYLCWENVLRHHHEC